MLQELHPNLVFARNNPSSATYITSLTLSRVSSFTYYPEGTNQQAITTGQVYNYVINFANGQSVSGSLIAQ